jgi:hypothetical protein
MQSSEVTGHAVSKYDGLPEQAGDLLGVRFIELAAISSGTCSSNELNTLFPFPEERSCRRGFGS